MDNQKQIVNEYKKKLRLSLTEMVNKIDSVVVDEYFDVATDVVPDLKALEFKLRQHCRNLLVGADILPEDIPFRSSTVDEDVKKEYEFRIEELKEESQKRIEEINEQRIEDLKTITTELRQTTKRKPDVDELPYSKRPRTIKFEDEEDAGNETDFGYITNGELEEENESEDETVEFGSKKKGGSKRKSSTSGRRTSARANKSEQEYTALEMRKCLHISLIGAAAKGGKKALNNKDVEGACSKAAHWYFSQLTSTLQKIFYTNYARERSPLKRGRGCHARFVTIFNEFLYSPAERKKVYLFMKRVFWEAVPDNFSANFAKNASDIMLQAVNYMFRMPFNEQLDPEHNKPLDNLYEAWKKKQLTNEFLHSQLDTGFGNLFFFAEDPVRLITSMFVCLAEGQNLLLGPELGKNDYGYYSIDYDTNEIVTNSKARPKVKRNLDGYINSNNGNLYYVKYKTSEDISFTKRWDTNKGSLIESDTAFHFETTLKPRAAFKFLFHFTKLASEAKMMRIFNDAFPTKFSGLKFSVFMKNVVRLGNEEAKSVCWTSDEMTDTYADTFKSSFGKAPKKETDKQPESDDEEEEEDEDDPPSQKSPAEPVTKQNKNKPEFSSAPKEPAQPQKNGAPKPKPKPKSQTRQMDSEVDESDDENPLLVAQPPRMAEKRLPASVQPPPAANKEDDNTSVSELDDASSEEDPKHPKPFKITNDLKKNNGAPKTDDLDNLGDITVKF